MTQRGGGGDWSIPYGIRDVFIIQSDFVQLPDRVDFTVGGTPNTIGGADNLNILEVNNLLRGFFVPDGNSEITLEFKPKDLKYSLIITCSSLTIILIMFIASFIYNRNEKF